MENFDENIILFKSQIGKLNVNSEKEMINSQNDVKKNGRAQAKVVDHY